jgi:hypothetical protein
MAIISCNKHCVLVLSLLLAETACGLSIVSPGDLFSFADQFHRHHTSYAASGESALTYMGTSNHLLSYNLGASLLLKYQDILVAHPLATQMLTGGVLAVAGDAVAQGQLKWDLNPHQQPICRSYDKRRAISFMAFDMAYRAVQHVLFPWIIANCHGQYGASILEMLGLSNEYADSIDGDTFMAAVERTMVNQLLVVPFLYYPFFFALTAIIQGLDAKAGYQRARSMFLPLMQRNLLFWLPVQFIQFRFVDEHLQIPFVCVAGLCWTVILSSFAGDSQQQVSNKKLDGSISLQTIVVDVEQRIDENGTAANTMWLIEGESS